MLLQGSINANTVSIMDQQSIIASIEDRAKGLGLPMAEVCRRAGIHPTTFSRWKLSGENLDPTGATIKSLTKLEAALFAAETAQDRAA